MLWTLTPAHPGPFTVDDLLPYRTAREPPCQTECGNRRTIMRKARSKERNGLYFWPSWSRLPGKAGVLALFFSDR